jgi:hypothetical protein
VLVALGKVEQAHDAGVVESSHDLDLLENIGSLCSCGREGGDDSLDRDRRGEGEKMR